MTPRPLAILIGCLCLLIGAGVVMFTQDSFAGDLRPDGIDPIEYEGPDPDVEPKAAVHSASSQDGVIDGGFSKSSGTGFVEPVAHKRESTAGWTKGVIRGDIKLAVSALDKLGSMTIIVEEARSAFDNGSHRKRPSRIVQKVERGRGTPTFEVRNVEFSEYPYIVTVHAPGLNGSQRTVVVNEEHPLVDDVILAITSGAPYTILLRDQDNNAHTGVTVNMLPVGLPHGRTSQLGVSDSYGAAIFEDVLAGEYEVRASQDGHNLGDPKRIVVQPGRRLVRKQVQGQGCTITIPRGVPVELLIHDAAGYGIPNATVNALKTDRHKPTEFEGTTDGMGRITFPHLQPGPWQLTVTCDKCQRVDLQIRLKAGEPPPPRRSIKLVRSRW